MDLLPAQGCKGVDEERVLGGVDPSLERLEGVVGVDRNGGRSEHGAVVDALVGDEVDHHASVVARPCSGLVVGSFDGVGAGEFAGKSRVQVDHLPGNAGEERHRQQAHEPGENDEVGLERVDGVGEPGVVVGPWFPGCGDTTMAGMPDRRARSSP